MNGWQIFGLIMLAIFIASFSFAYGAAKAVQGVRDQINNGTFNPEQFKA